MNFIDQLTDVNLTFDDAQLWYMAFGIFLILILFAILFHVFGRLINPRA